MCTNLIFHRLIITLDECYYTLYYCIELHLRSNTTSHNKQQSNKQQHNNCSTNRMVSPIPPPHVYFTSLIVPTEAQATGLDNFLSDYLVRNVSTTGISALRRVWGSKLPIFSTETTTSSANRSANVNDSTQIKALPSSTASAVKVHLKNPLLDVHFARWRESVCLLSLLGNIPDETEVHSMRSACRAQSNSADHTNNNNNNNSSGAETLTMKGSDPLLPAELRKWNDSCRVWPCHLYAFATPTTEAVMKLHSLAPLVEIGAGTGYWAHLIRSMNMNMNISTAQAQAHSSSKNAADSRGSGVQNVVHAYDKDPPSASAGDKVKPNEYHGRSKAWTSVSKGGPESAALHCDNNINSGSTKISSNSNKSTKSATLFLCYPPPDNAMGLLALRAYTGDTVCYVGEWQGDTGTSGFQKLLASTFQCEEIVHLPNWGDTCYMLMVWQRRKGIVANAANTTKPSSSKDSKLHNKSNGSKGQGITNGTASSSAKNNVPVIPEHLLTHPTHPVRCSVCGTGRRISSSSSSSSDSSIKELYRCRLTYNVYFCSTLCAGTAEGRAVHLDELAIKCLLQRKKQDVNTNTNPSGAATGNTTPSATSESRKRKLSIDDTETSGDSALRNEEDERSGDQIGKERSTDSCATSSDNVDNQRVLESAVCAGAGPVGRPLLELNTHNFVRIQAPCIL